MIVKIPSTADAGAAMRIHLVIAAIIEDNSRERDFIVGNIRVGTDLIRVLYISSVTLSYPYRRMPASISRCANEPTSKTREPPKHARKVYKKPAQATLQGA